MHDPRVVELLQRQSGVISYRQALEVGVTAEQIRQRCAKGVLSRVTRGVYRHALFTDGWRARLIAGVLATKGLASHRSAGSLQCFPGIRPGPPEIVVAHGRWRPLDGVVIHQTTQLNRVDEIDVGGVPCTGRGRTILDLGVSMRAGRLGDAVDALLRVEEITQAELWDVLVRHSVQGRVGCGPLREVLEARRGESRIALSQWSYMVANLLESAGLERPRLEFRAHDRCGQFLAQIDLAYPQAMLAIELDSVAFHHNLSAFRKDRSRARQLTVAGWTVLQFTWEDYTERPDQLIAQVSGILRRVVVGEQQ